MSAGEVREFVCADRRSYNSQCPAAGSADRYCDTWRIDFAARSAIGRVRATADRRRRQASHAVFRQSAHPFVQGLYLADDVGSGAGGLSADRHDRSGWPPSSSRVYTLIVSSAAARPTATLINYGRHRAYHFTGGPASGSAFGNVPENECSGDGTNSVTCVD